MATAASTQGDRYKKAYYFVLREGQVLVFEFTCKTADKDAAVAAAETLFDNFHTPTLP